MKRIEIIDTATCFHGNFNEDYLIYNSETKIATCRKCGESFTVTTGDMNIEEIEKSIKTISDFINNLKIIAIANKVELSTVGDIAKMAEAIDILDTDKMKEICTNYAQKNQHPEINMPAFLNELNFKDPNISLMKGLSDEVMKLMTPEKEEKVEAESSTKEKKSGKK